LVLLREQELVDPILAALGHDDRSKQILTQPLLVNSAPRSSH
jgi:hypothetical protein